MAARKGKSHMQIFEENHRIIRVDCNILLGFLQNNLFYEYHCINLGNWSVTNNNVSVIFFKKGYYYTNHSTIKIT